MKICKFKSTVHVCTNTVIYDHVGVYISHDGEFIEPDSNILITNIGTAPPQQLVCTSDRMPCCHTPQYGEWKFPNGNQVVHITEGAVAFSRNRDNVGNINLFRVSSDVMSPTGRFCCEVEDAIDMNQTVCVNLGEPNCTDKCTVPHPMRYFMEWG